MRRGGTGHMTVEYILLKLDVLFVVEHYRPVSVRDGFDMLLSGFCGSDYLS